MKLYPFKIDKNYRTDFAAIEVARQIIGRPTSEFYFSNKFDCIWNFRSNYRNIELSITQVLHAEQLIIDYQIEVQDGPVHWPSYREEDIWSINLKKFIEAVKKPWGSWEEKEIISNPMWIYLFQLENRTPDKYHNAMVLFSFQNPEDQWVKRYFQDAKEKNGQDCQESACREECADQ